MTSSDNLNYISPKMQSVQLTLENHTEQIHYITRFAVDENDLIYTIDDVNYRLCKFTPIGKLIYCSGTTGHGPGEFIKGDIYFLKYFNEKLYVYSIKSKIIKLFDKQLNFIKDIYFEDQFYSFDIDSTYNALYSYMSHKNSEILLYNDVSINSDFKPDKLNLYYNLLLFKIFNSSYAITAYTYRNKLNIICLPGYLCENNSTFTIPSYPEFSEVSEPYVPDKIIIQDIIVTNNREIWILAGDHATNARREIHRFSISDGYVNSFLLPEATPQVEFINSHLYTISEDRSSIIKHKIDF